MEYNLELKYHNALELASISDASITFSEVSAYVCDEFVRVARDIEGVTVKRKANITEYRSLPYEVVSVKFDGKGEVTLFSDDIQIPEGFKLVKIDEDNTL